MLTSQKILTFVCESKPSGRSAVLPSSVQEQASKASLKLEDSEKEIYGSPHHANMSPRQPLVSEIDHVAVFQKIAQIFHPKENDSPLFFAYIIHILLLNHLSVQDRARHLEPICENLRNHLITSFLPAVFLATEQAIVALNTTIDVDVRIFLSLTRFFADNPRISMVNAFGPELAKMLQTDFPSFVIPISEFAHLAQQFLPRTSSPSPSTLKLLPFTNRIFDEELAPLHDIAPSEGDGNNVEPSESEDEEGEDNKWDTSSGEEDEESNDDQSQPETEGAMDSGFFDDGVLYHDTQHWHNNRKPILPKQLGEAGPTLTEWQRKKRLRADQQFMRSLHNQAATLTGALGAALQQIKIPAVGSAPASKVILYFHWCVYDLFLFYSIAKTSLCTPTY